MVELKVNINKRNNQLNVAIPRKKFLILKKKNPKSIVLRGSDLRF